MYTVYKITNKINNKVYVGVTTQQPPINRWYKHRSDYRRKSSNFPLYKAFLEYGLWAFEFNILEQGDDDNIRFDREIYWINKLDSYKNGYNATIGGKQGLGRIITEETRKKLSESAVDRIGKYKYYLHNVLTDNVLTFNNAADVINYLNITQYCFYKRLRKGVVVKNYVLTYDKLKHDKKKKRPLVGWKMSDEDKKKISESNKLRIKNGHKTYFQLNNPRKRTVYQYDMEGNFIKKYQSVSEAVRSLGLTTHTNIAKCARGERNKAAGYVWRYKLI